MTLPAILLRLLGADAPIIEALPRNQRCAAVLGAVLAAAASTADAMSAGGDSFSDACTRVADLLEALDEAFPELRGPT